MIVLSGARKLQRDIDEELLPVRASLEIAIGINGGGSGSSA